MTTLQSISPQHQALSQQWTNLLQEQPGLRIRNASQQLGVSELELLLTRLGQGVVLLTPAFAQILIDLEHLGSVMALTRNEQVVHERHGTYTGFRVNKAGTMGICLGDIDLRTFFKHWAVACAVVEGEADKARKSIQFFNTEGTAVHKVYLTRHTDENKWDDLIRKYTRPNQEADFISRAIPDKSYPNSGQVAEESLRNAWSELKDVHHFQAMLERLGIDRLEALSLAGPDYAQTLNKQAAEHTLQLAADRQLDLMVFVGNGNIVQIHTGKVHKLKRTGTWFNVLDPEFNLHINTADIEQIWSVKRPTADGIVSSVECFNARRELVLTFFGARKPGKPELESWRKLVSELEQKG